MALGEIGEEITDLEIEDMIEVAQKDESDSVTFTDFLRILNESANDVIQLTEDYVRNKC